MKTQVIPAQITTVEDKIAGNLNLTQLLILISPMLVIAFVFILLPPAMKVTGYKGIIFAVSVVLAVTLSLRIKGKVVINWLGILLLYNLRPKYYLYNKNETYLRKMDLLKRKRIKTQKADKALSKKKHKNPVIRSGIKDLVNFEDLISRSKVDLRYRSGKKGGVNVAFDQIKR